MDVPCVPGSDYPQYLGTVKGVRESCTSPVTDKQLGEKAEGPVIPLLRHHRTVPGVIKPQCWLTVFINVRICTCVCMHGDFSPTFL